MSRDRPRKQQKEASAEQPRATGDIFKYLNGVDLNSVKKTTSSTHTF